MNEPDELQLHEWLAQAAPGFAYPPIPDVTRQVQERLTRRVPNRRVRLQAAWVALSVVLVGALLLLAPQVRAAVLQMLRAGGITIFVTEPTPPVEAPDSPLAPESPLAPAAGATTARVTPSLIPATATFAAGDESSVLLIAATPSTLEAARASFGQPIRLPTYPPQLGAPDQVFVDDRGTAEVVVLVWLEDVGKKPRYTLYAIAAEEFGFKSAEVVEATSVDGTEAFWIEGPHGFSLGSRDAWHWQESGSAVLIWSPGELTYRLEGATSIEEARKIAESLE